MRFVVFYNDHPKVQDFSVRVWHLFQEHPNFYGEMTHFDFVRHYHLKPTDVSSLGDVFYNKKTKQWEIDDKRPVVSIKDERIQQDKMLVLNYMRQNFYNNEEMINFSLREQQLIIENRIKTLMKKNMRSI